MIGTCFVLLAGLALASAESEALTGCPAADVYSTTKHLADPTDCGAYYSFYPHLEHCPEGLHFNPKKQVCDTPENAGCQCSGGESTTEGGGNGGNCPAVGSCPAVDPLDHTVHLPHQSDCTLFCRCDHGSPKLDHCPDGLHFNPKLQVCDWPNAAGCSSGGGNGNNTTTESGNGGDITTEGSGNVGNCPAVGSCPAVDPLDHTVHLPHQSDCTLFCRCDHGSPKLDHCPDGLHFNPKLQVCDWPNAAGCSSGGGNGNNTTTESGNGGDITTEGSGNVGNCPAVGSCPAVDPLDHTVHLPHQSDCTLFCRCDHGSPKLDHCPDGLHFNPKLQVCDWPNAAGCSSGGGNGNNTTTESGNGGDITTEGSGNVGNCPAVGSCPAVDPLDHTVHLPHQSDCTLFCRCDHGSPKLDHCPDGLHFNPKLQVCDWPNAAGCSSGGGNGNNTTTESGNGGDITTEGSGNVGNCPAVGSCPAVDPLDHTVHLPHQSDCTLFCRCDHGSPKLDHCPDGLHFNPKLQVCDWPNAAGCSSGGGNGNNTTTESGNGGDITTEGSGNVGNCPAVGSCPAVDPLDHTVHLPHQSDCTLFCRCDHGSPKLDHCPDGLHFNPKLQVCDWPNAAGCSSGGGNGGETTTEGGNGGGGGDEGNCPAVGSCPAVDPLDHTVHLPHQSDCTLFCRCDHGSPKLDHCPDGLHFNPKLQVCDWPNAAGCVIADPTCKPLANNNRSHWEPTVCSSEPSDIGNKCHLACDSGFELSGSLELQCTEAGWDGTGGLNILPSCKTEEELGEDLVNNINKTLGTKANLLFLLDESGSVARTDFDMEVKFVKALISAFPLSENRSAGIITFNSDAEVDVTVATSETCGFLKKADAIQYHAGGTDILEALNLAVKEIEKSSIHNLTLVFLITDGESSTDPTAPANIIKNNHDTLFTIGVGNYKRDQLEPISSEDKNGAKLFYGIRNFDVFNAVANYLSTVYGNGTAINC